MDYDEFKRREEERKRQNFNRFKSVLDDTLRKQGSSKTADEIFGGSRSVGGDAQPEDPRRARVSEILEDLIKNTTDEDPADALVRALAVYQSIVHHAQTGGTVKFVAADGTEKTLKVRAK